MAKCEWTAWEQFQGDPYVHWRKRFIKLDGDPLLDQDVGRKVVSDNLKRLLEQAIAAILEKLALDAEAEAVEETAALAGGDRIDIRSTLEDLFEDLDVRLPKNAAPERSQMGDPLSNSYPRLDRINDLDALPIVTDKDMVFVGVIDIGIPLGHNRFRNADGTTRILSAWQQTATWVPGSVPFGREIHAPEINQLLKDHSGRDLMGWLDEDAFNRASGVVDLRHTYGDREAAGRVSHGAHVTDLAAGADPVTEAEYAKKVKILAVNAPDSRIFGASGEYIDAFLLAGICRIISVADAIWHKSRVIDNTLPEERPRIVINISFGKQAGSKTSLDLFSRFLKHFRDSHPGIDFVMPVGNDNLARCNALLEPGALGKADDALSLDWRVQPEDQSSNFVEVWTSAAETSPRLLAGPAGGIEVTLTGPNGTCVSAQPTEEDTAVGDPQSTRRSMSSCRGIAAIYREIWDAPPNEKEIDDDPRNSAAESAVVADTTNSLAHRHVRHVLCLAPTYDPRTKIKTAPAGRWKITVKNLTGERIQCVVSVQSDQQIKPGNPINRRSYFDDPCYRVYDETGRLVESYAYPFTRPYNLDLIEGGPEGAKRRSPVRRHGTLNSSAAHKHVARVGGYRVSDGRPAAYSSTGRGRQPKSTLGKDDDGTIISVARHQGSRAPTASLAVDDGPMHPGVLSAGAANGSVVAFRGTSFAAAQATRLIAKYLIEKGPLPDRGESILFEAAASDRDNSKPNGLPWDPKKPGASVRGLYLIENLGGGRISQFGRTRSMRTSVE